MTVMATTCAVDGATVLVPVAVAQITATGVRWRCHECGHGHAQNLTDRPEILRALAAAGAFTDDHGHESADPRRRQAWRPITGGDVDLFTVGLEHLSPCLVIGEAARNGRTTP